MVPLTAAAIADSNVRLPTNTAREGPGKNMSARIDYGSYFRVNPPSNVALNCFGPDQLGKPALFRPTSLLSLTMPPHETG